VEGCHIKRANSKVRGCKSFLILSLVMTGAQNSNYSTLGYKSYSVDYAHLFSREQ
jgi:hypothetical protein